MIYTGNITYQLESDVLNYSLIIIQRNNETLLLINLTNIVI